MTKGVGKGAISGPTRPGSVGEPPTKTVVISWIEESHHEVTVRVAQGFDPYKRDLAKGLAELNDDGFEGLQRNLIEVREAADDPAAEFFNPPRYDEGTSS
jgi:hypothetical protein